MDVAVKKGVATSFIVVISFIYDSLGILFIILTALMAIDYVTGLTSAWIKKSQSSKRGIIGIVKKVSYMLLVVTALLFDLAVLHMAANIDVTMPFNSVFGTTVICWLISNESLSIIENLDKIGVPIPKFLNQSFEKFKIFIENLTQDK